MFVNNFLDKYSKIPIYIYSFFSLKWKKNNFIVNLTLIIEKNPIELFFYVKAISV